MKKALAVAGAAALVLGPLAGTATSEEHPEGPPPRHGHLLLIGMEYDASGEPVNFRKCIELAGGKRLPLKAHHMTVHTGKAGEALLAAGKMAVPTAPLAPWSNCDEFVEMIFSGSGE